MVLIVKWLPPKSKALMLTLFLLLFVAQFDAPNNETSPPHTLWPCHASSPQSLLLLLPFFGWLLCFLSNPQPPKAEVPSLSLFFDRCNIGSQNKGMKSPQSAPDASHHHQNHSYPCCKEFVAWQDFPWRLRATSRWIGGRWRPILLCVVCCHNAHNTQHFCVLCRFCWLFLCWL